MYFWQVDNGSAYLADDCRLLSEVAGRRPLQSNSNDIRKLLVQCREHRINLVIGVPRPPVLDRGTIFHPDGTILQLLQTISEI